jgi:hypothetical protein
VRSESNFFLKKIHDVVFIILASLWSVALFVVILKKLMTTGLYTDCGGTGFFVQEQFPNTHIFLNCLKLKQMFTLQV